MNKKFLQTLAATATLTVMLGGGVNAMGPEAGKKLHVAPTPDFLTQLLELSPTGTGSFVFLEIKPNRSKTIGILEKGGWEYVLELEERAWNMPLKLFISAPNRSRKNDPLEETECTLMNADVPFTFNTLRHKKSIAIDGDFSDKGPRHCRFML